MTGLKKCSHCGAELPPDVPGGHCLQCLLQLGLESGSTDTGLAGSFKASPAAFALSEKAGDRIGRYKLLQQIGEGGCGVIYMAEQEEPVRRRVALKIIKLGMDTRQVIARFEAERQALALMDHPNIAKVLDAGATDTGRPFFVMELVRGIKITDYCDLQEFPTRRRLELFVQVCQAVTHAHQKGIIHRDLKPSNILVTEQDGEPMPKIIDFGIAKATTDQQLTDKTLFTAFEQFLGTPAYMSPEQAGLGGLDIDTRSDNYSLGVLLYELLTGQPPFDPEALRRSALDEVLRTIREKEPPSPSTCLTALNREDLTTVAQRRQIEPAKLPKLLSGDLDWIVMKALEKNRSRRYETANSLARDVQRHLDNEPVLARPPGSLYRFQKLARRNKLAFAAAAAVTASLLIGLGVSTRLFVKEHEAREEVEISRRQALADERKAQSEAAKSRQVKQILEDMLKAVGPSVALGRDTQLLQEILDKTAERVGKDLTNQPAVEAELRNIIGEVYRDLGDYQKAGEMHRQALIRLKEVAGAENVPDVAATLHHLALDYIYQRNYPEAEARENEALAMRMKHLGNENPEVAESLDDLAWILMQRGKLVEAEIMYRKALDMESRVLPGDQPAVAETINNLAVVVQRLNRLPEAENLFREALAMRRRLFGEAHPKVAESLGNLGLLLEGQRRLAEAETTTREALAMSRKVLGEGHPEVAGRLNALLGILERERKFAEAETLLRETLALRRKLFGEADPKVAKSLFSLGVFLGGQGRLAEAETKFRETLAMQRKLSGNEQLEVAATLDRLAVNLETQGRLSEAEIMERDALAVWRKLPGDQNRNVVNSLNHLAVILVRLGRPADVEQSFNEFLGPEEQARPPSAVILRARANFLARAGRWPDAAADFTRLIELGPTNYLDQHCLAPLLVAAGDLDNYRRLCQTIITRFGDSPDADTDYRLAKDCLILPSAGSGADPAVLGNLARRAVSLVITNNSLPWYQLETGLAEYRQGNFASALDRLGKVPPTSSSIVRNVEVCMVLAMAEYQSKHIDEARAAFAKGAEMAGTKLPKLESGDIGTGWLDWIIAHALMDEAKALLDGTPRANSLARSPAQKSTIEAHAAATVPQ